MWIRDGPRKLRRGNHNGIARRQWCVTYSALQVRESGQAPPTELPSNVQGETSNYRWNFRGLWRRDYVTVKSMPEYLKASDQMTRKRDNIRMTDSDHRIIKNNSFILFGTLERRMKECFMIWLWIVLFPQWNFYLDWIVENW